MADRLMAAFGCRRGKRGTAVTNGRLAICATANLFCLVMLCGCISGNPGGDTRVKDSDFFVAVCFRDVDRARSMVDQSPGLVHATCDPSQHMLLGTVLSKVVTQDTSGFTPLHAASFVSTTGKSRRDIVKLLIERGGDVNARTSKGMTPLHYAVTHGDAELAQLLLANSAAVNAEDDLGRTPLYWCSTLSVEAGRGPMMELLRQRGAIDQFEWTLARMSKAAEGKQRGDATHPCDTQLVMEMFEAAGSGNLSKVKSLLGREPQLVDAPGLAGMRPLMEASLHGHRGVVELLIAEGANVNGKNANGNTALHFAAPGGHEAIVRTLLAHGADKMAENTDGEKPIDRAAKSGQKRIVVLLMRRGGGRQ